MEFNFKLCGLLVIFSLAQVSRAQLKCYVCENCDQVSGSTPLLDCDEDFFNGGGNNEPSTQTTTAMPPMTTEMPTEMSSTSSSTTDRTSAVSTTESTTTPMTTTTTSSETTMSPHTTTSGITTESNGTSTTSSMSTSTNVMPSSTSSSVSPSTTTTEHFPVTTTEATTHLGTTTTSAVSEETTTIIANTTGTMQSNSTLAYNSTEQQPPTPSTAHPTISIPTPPNPSAGIPVDDIVRYNVNGSEADHGSTKPYIVSSQFRQRQTRAVSDYSYQCFKVTASVNGTMATNRGCSRVKTSESVCGQWKEQHPTEKLNKCHPCSNTRCNGSTALNLSLGAMALTLVAAALQMK